jgi:hypothetical protein
MSAGLKHFAWLDADPRMTKFLERCRGAGGTRPAHLGVRAGRRLFYRSDDGHADGASSGRIEPRHRFSGSLGMGFLLFPVFSGVLILVLIAWLYNNAVRKAPYPHYW